jgi:hypothetical protein
MSSGSHVERERDHFVLDFRRCEKCGKPRLGADDIICDMCRVMLALPRMRVIEEMQRNVLD